MVTSGDLVQDETAVEADQCSHRSSGETLEPIHNGSSGRNPRQAAEAREEGIALDVLQMLEPTATDEQQSDHHHHQPRRAVVPAERACGEGFPDAAGKLEATQEPTNHLQPCVGSELLGAELDA